MFYPHFHRVIGSNNIQWEIKTQCLFVCFSLSLFLFFSSSFWGFLLAARPARHLPAAARTAPSVPWLFSPTLAWAVLRVISRPLPAPRLAYLGYFLPLWPWPSCASSLGRCSHRVSHTLAIPPPPPWLAVLLVTANILRDSSHILLMSLNFLLGRSWIQAALMFHLAVLIFLMLSLSLSLGYFKDLIIIDNSLEGWQRHCNVI